MPFEQDLGGLQSRIERVLAQYLPPEERPPSGLHAAMRYAVLGGGKRIRPLLVYLTGTALGAGLEALDAPAAAVELIHAYSLVHDDLPAMDDDALRRGRPTCHKVFGEATAILAGDALQALAFEVLAGDSSTPLPPSRRLRMLAALARASGADGMAGGQALDLAAVGQELSLRELEHMHLYKTGALIRASVQLGALAADAVDGQVLDGLDRFARCIGLAFQVRDDILDVEGRTETIGKPQGSDQERNKPTYPQLLGLEEAKAAAARLMSEAIGALEPLGERGAPLRALAEYIVQREK